MIIERERKFPVFDTKMYERMGPPGDIDHQVPPASAAFLAKRQEVRDTNTHH
jgi:hypothetical protein